MKEDRKSIQVQFDIDLNSKKAVGRVTQGATREDIDKINRDIHKAIEKAVNNLFDWVKEFDELVATQKYNEAFNLLKVNKGSIRLSKSSILNTLKKLDFNQLSPDHRKEALITVIGTASIENRIGEVEYEIDKLLAEFKESLENDLLASILLTKANAAAVNGKLNMANAKYREVLEMTNIETIDKAYAHRGLSKILPFKEDMISHQEQAIDFFLQAGDVKEAIKDIVELSRRLQNIDVNKSLSLIDKAIGLYGSTEVLDMEYKASLYHSRAVFLFSMYRYQEAYNNAKVACELREGLIGNELERCSSYYLAMRLAKELSKLDEFNVYRKKYEVESAKIESTEHIIAKKLSDSVSFDAKLDDTLVSEIEASNDANLKYALYITMSIKKDQAYVAKLEWIDKALLILEHERFSNLHFSTCYFSLAEIYRVNNVPGKAIESYKKAIDYNPFHMQAIQNCGAVLWQEKRWEESVSFFIDRIEQLGQSSSLSYALGRSYFECNRYQEAFDQFRVIKDSINGVDIQKYIAECIEKSENLRLTTIPKQEQTLVITSEELKEALLEFANSVSKNSRMDFWTSEKGKHKWATSPEKKAKHYLITGLKMKFGDDCIDIIQERPAGAGIIDLYVRLRGGLNLVIELKMCGSPGYSSSYALSGKDQLLHYMDNINVHLGVLVVFDARRREFGKGFKDIQVINSKTIQTIVVDVRPTVKN